MPPKKKDKNKKTDEPQRLRVAIVNADRCKPKKCRLECKKYCPVNKAGKICIEVGHTDKISWISEDLCVGCNICVKRCPFDAIRIVNLPKDLGSELIHRFSANSFKIHRLPTPRPGQVLGLVGTNGIGKSTTLRMLSGKLKPNMGRFTDPPEWREVLDHFRGSELQAYFQRILNDQIKAIIKPQYVDNLAKTVKGKVGEIIKLKDSAKRSDKLIADLELGHLLERNVSDLSGGELQRFAICVVAIQVADVYMFDEPSSYLDIKQRLAAAKVIRDINTVDSYMIVVEHDLAILDYLSDFTCVLWGQPSVYGVVSLPCNVRDGINHFLEGYIPTDNLRTRTEPLNFKLSTEDNLGGERSFSTEYGEMSKTLGTFTLDVEAGDFNTSEIIVMLGQNGTGKSTLIRMLAGLLKPDNAVDIPVLSISYKPQTVNAKFTGTVEELLQLKIREQANNPTFQSEVLKALSMEDIMDQSVQNLSGGELQRVAIVVALGKPADVYLIDEPSAYLDSEQRIITSKVIKRFIMNTKKTAFIVEHDFIMATYLADRVIVYDGQPGIKCRANKPMSLNVGMNKFLKDLDITIRRDPSNYRPRINKDDSQMDKEQKGHGRYFTSEAEGKKK